MACLRSKIFKINIPSETPRTDDFRKEVGKMAASVKVKEFVPDDDAAKEIQASVEKESTKNEGEEGQEEIKQEEEDDISKLKKEFATILKDLSDKEKGEDLV